MTEDNKCPQCKAELIQVNTNGTAGGIDIYCEECGYPDENRTSTSNKKAEELAERVALKCYDAHKPYCVAPDSCPTCLTLKATLKQILLTELNLPSLLADKDRLEHYLGNQRDVTCNELVELHLRELANDYPTMAEWRAAIDKDRLAIDAARKEGEKV